MKASILRLIRPKLSQLIQFQSHSQITNIRQLTIAPQYHFCQNIAKVDCHEYEERLQKLINYCKQQTEKTYITSEVEKLTSDIDLFTSHQLLSFAAIFQKASYNEDVANKIYDKNIQLYLSNSSQLNVTLQILSLITSTESSSDFCNKQLQFLVAVVDAPHLNAQSIALAMLIYGQLIQLEHCNDDDTEFLLISHAMSQINNFDSKSLSLLSQGVMLAQLESEEIVKLFETQTQAIDMDIDDLVRIGSVLAKLVQGSEEFWNFFQREIAKKQSELHSSTLILLMMILQNLDYKTLESQNVLENTFLSLYTSLTLEEKLFLYSGFARMVHLSSKLWEQFERDFEEITKNQPVQQSISLIYQSFNVFEIFSEELQQSIFSYVIENSNEIDPKLKKIFLEKLLERNIITEEEARIDSK